VNAALSTPTALSTNAALSANAAQNLDAAVARLASTIGEEARTRMLFCLMDGRARTSTELAMVAQVTPSTASAHLSRLNAEGLVKLAAQGRHRYYSLGGARVARALEGLSVLAGGRREDFVPSTPGNLRTARSCYDHMAGTVAVLLHDRMKTLGWLVSAAKRQSVGVKRRQDEYELTAAGEAGLAACGVAVDQVRTQRRRFAYACLDWSERRPHLGGALGAALLELSLKRRWLSRELDSRALSVTKLGQREFAKQFGIEL
jgi:DNA-binding transcriptional ArsR family regulator